MPYHYFKRLLVASTILVSSILNVVSINSPQVQAEAGNTIQLITNSKTSTDGVNWVQGTSSNNGKYQQFLCDSQQFNVASTPNMTPKVNGIADYNDGLTKKNIQLKPNASFVGNFRDCGDYKIKANGQTVFAYQYTFDYQFPADKKASESARYRVHTYQDGDYDGVQYTFTYYNFWNPQKNAWNGWENPNKSNELGGFLAYAINPKSQTPELTASLPNPDQQSTKFTGKIGNNEIEMYLTDLELSGDKMGQKLGSYSYVSQKKTIELRKINARIGGAFAVLEEFVNGQKTGDFTVDSFDKNIMKGTWTNAQNNVNLPFEVKKVENNSVSSQSQQVLNGETLLLVEKNNGGVVLGAIQAKYAVKADLAQKFKLYDFSVQTNIKVWGKYQFTNSGERNIFEITKIEKIEKSSSIASGQTYPFSGILTFSEYTDNGAVLYACGGTCTYFEISSELLKKFGQKTFNKGDLIKAEGRINDCEKIPKCVKFVEVNNFLKIGESSSQNNSQLTGTDLAKAFIADSGSCFIPGQHILPLDSKAECIFRLKNKDLITDYLKNGGNVKAEILAASSSGRSDFCVLKTTAGFSEPHFSCPNTPTGSKEKNATALNPSDIALFFSNESGDHGYINGKVQIDYGGSNQSSVNNLSGDIGINGEVGFLKAIGKSMISLQADVSNYNRKENLRISIYIPVKSQLELSSKDCKSRNNKPGENYKIVWECEYSKEYLTSNKLLFTIEKLPDDYDPNKVETQPQIQTEIFSTGPSFQDSNLTNNTQIITVGPL